MPRCDAAAGPPTTLVACTATNCFDTRSINLMISVFESTGSDL